MGKRQEAREPLELVDVPPAVLVELYSFMEMVEPVLSRMLGPGESGTVRFQGVHRSKVLDSLDAVVIGRQNTPLEVRVDLQKQSPELRTDRRYILLALRTGTAGLRTEIGSRTTGKPAQETQTKPRGKNKRKGRVTNT